VVLAGVQMQPVRVLAKSGIHKRRAKIAVFRFMDRAVAAATERSRMGRLVTGELAVTSAP
jgi:hypothetical protein